MNVFIFPTDDRSGQISMIYHYSKLGHNVFVPQFGTLGLNWKRIATWPALLCKSSVDKSKRNLEIHGFVRGEDDYFGEDFFLTTFESGELYADDISCEIINLETASVEIDVFHTLRGGEAYIDLYHEIAAKYFPKAKWVSSTFNQMTSSPANRKPTNAAKLVPAPYESHHQDINNVCLVSPDFEIRLLNANETIVKRDGFASFNHNFAHRQPTDYQLFQEMNALLVATGFPEVPNYGGNIRTQGADIRYSGQKGITGNLHTLTPRDAYNLTRKLRASVHFKEIDWGGGVFYYSLNAETPIITTHRYVQASHSEKYLKDGVNAILVNTAREAADAVIWLQSDIEWAQSLSRGMSQVKKQIFSEQYWQNWATFLGGLQ